MPRSKQCYFLILAKQIFCSWYNRTSSIPDLILYSSSAVNFRFALFDFFVLKKDFFAASAQGAQCAAAQWICHEYLIEFQLRTISGRPRQAKIWQFT